jgi:hypothetical protein
MPPIKTKFTTKPFTPIKGGQQCIRSPLINVSIPV